MELWRSGGAARASERQVEEETGSGRRERAKGETNLQPPRGHGARSTRGGAWCSSSLSLSSFSKNGQLKAMPKINYYFSEHSCVWPRE